jgi:MoxR-like ATPase
LIRLQCYEGLDEAKALYEWDYRKQLLRIQAARQDQDARPNQGAEGAEGVGGGQAGGAAWSAIETDIFGEDFLLARPLLEAIRAEDRVVLLVDEVDRLDVETEALLLEVLSDYQVSIPELGTITARQRPMVFLTSNNSRELSEALKRRCLFLHLDYPSVEREREIILTRVPGIGDRLAGQVAEIVRSLRGMELKKRPSVSETLDWANTLMLLSADTPLEKITDAVLRQNLNVLLKHQSDIELARERFSA